MREILPAAIAWLNQYRWAKLHTAFTLTACVAIIPVAAFSAGSTDADATPTKTRPSYPATLTGGSPCGSCEAPDALASNTTVAAASEPGERIEISGTIYQPDGKTPAKDIVLYVYHTDATGFYNKDDDPSHPRIRGWMKTGADGKYRFDTIKPAPYPHRTTPAHIHAHVYGPGVSEYAIDDYWFEGDPFITSGEFARHRKDGSTPIVVALKRDRDGVLKGVRDVMLKSSK